MPLKLGSKPLKIVGPDYNIGFLRMLIYGDSGVGKTRLMGSALDVPELCPILYCDSDKGTMSIAKLPLQVLPISDLADMENAIRYVKGNPGEYKTIILDGISSLYTTIMQERLQSPSRGQKEDPYVPSQRDWMHATFRVRALLQLALTAPVNFLVTALVDERADEFTGALMIRPGLSNKLAQEIGAWFDILGYMYVKTVKREDVRYLQLNMGSNRKAKNRSVYDLPKIISEPTMEILYGRSVLGKTFDDSKTIEGGEDEEITRVIKKSDTEEATEAIEE